MEELSTSSRQVQTPLTFFPATASAATQDLQLSFLTDLKCLQADWLA